MSSKKHLDNMTDSPDDSENEADVQKESCVKVPQYGGAKKALADEQKIISEATDKPIKGPFTSKKETVGNIRKRIGELPGYKTDKKTQKKNFGQKKPDRPAYPFKGLDKRR